VFSVFCPKLPAQTEDSSAAQEGGAVSETHVAVYPGSFDPITNGHLDLVERGAKIFGRLIVAVLRNSGKHPLFSVEERVEMLRESVKPWPNVSVDAFDGLLVDYAAKVNAKVILRGLRAVSDFENEMQMALMNRKLDKNLEIVFMMPGVAYTYLSSRLVREVVQLGGDVRSFVPPIVSERLQAKINGDRTATIAATTVRAR
jgi:pantetheine-phosphate adenylyltransferase